MRHRLLPLLVGLIWSVLVASQAAPAMAGECSACAPGEKDASLCATHEAIEKEQLPALQLESRNKKKASDRIKALQSIAALTSDHANAPSRPVAEALAEALDDKDPSVSDEAARLLGAGQHAPTAGKRLNEALEKSQKVIERGSRTSIKNSYIMLSLMSRNRELPHPANLAARKLFFKDIAKDLENLQNYRAAEEKVQQKIDAEVKLRLSALESAAQVADPTSRPRVYGYSVAVAYRSDSHAAAACDVMLRWGSREVAQLSVLTIKRYADALKSNKEWLELEKDYEEMCRDAPPEIKMPPVKGAFSEKLLPYGESVYAHLERFAAANGIEELPPWNERTCGDSATQWFDRNKSKLPQE